MLSTDGESHGDLSPSPLPFGPDPVTITHDLPVLVGQNRGNLLGRVKYPSFPQTTYTHHTVVS